MNTRVPRWLTWGLLAAWTAHDIEELVTMPEWTRNAQDRTIFGVPAPIPEMSEQQAAVSIGLTGLMMAVAAREGARTGGRSRLFQCALAAFGWHSVSHVASSVIWRGYTPGIATVVPVVVPFYLLARSELKRQGVAVDNRRLAPGALILFVLTLAIAHSAARMV